MSHRRSRVRRATAMAACGACDRLPRVRPLHQRGVYDERHRPRHHRRYPGPPAPHPETRARRRPAPAQRAALAASRLEGGCLREGLRGPPEDPTGRHAPTARLGITAPPLVRWLVALRNAQSRTFFARFNGRYRASLTRRSAVAASTTDRKPGPLPAAMRSFCRATRRYWLGSRSTTA